MEYEIIERTIDKREQYLFPADVEVNTWWTNTNITDEELIKQYHAHGESEQFHSEIKTDTDLERLPLGKFNTNELILELTILAYNILRMIVQETIGRRCGRQKRPVRCRHIRTVINNLVMIAGHITEHARQISIGPGRSNTWCFAFAEVYGAFAAFWQ